MSMEDLKAGLKDLLDKRANLWTAEAQPLIDAATTRDLTADELAKEVDIDAAFVRFDRAIARTRDQIAAEEQRQAMGLDGRTPSTRTSNVAEKIRSVLRREAPAVDLKFDGSTLSRALGTGTTSDGAGNTIPSTLWPEFLVPLRDAASVIDAGARVIVTDSGETVEIPYLKAFGAAETGTSPNTEMTGTDPVFGLVEWSTTKKDQIIYVPRELVEDSAIDIEALVGSLVGLNVGLKVGAAATAAVATGVTVGVTGATTKYTPTFDEVIDLEHSVPRMYRKGSAYLANDSLTKVLRKIKDTQGQYLWQPAVAIDQPDTLNGKAYLTDAFLDDPAANKIPLLYGNFGLGVWVRMVGALRLERSDQAAWAKDQIGFKAVLRTGQAVVDANAIKSFKGGAAS